MANTTLSKDKMQHIKKSLGAKSLIVIIIDDDGGEVRLDIDDDHLSRAPVVLNVALNQYNNYMESLNEG